MTGVQTFRKKPLEVKAIQFDGTNVADIWDTFGAEGIYGPTETNPDHLILTTTHGDPAPARVGDWVVPDSKPNTFYPIAAEVMERTYDPAESLSPAESTEAYDVYVDSGEAHERFKAFCLTLGESIELSWRETQEA